MAQKPGIGQVPPAPVAPLEKKVDYLVRVVAALAEPVFGETTQIKFHETLQPLTGTRVKEECPFNAAITSIAFHFPPGCDGLVDVMVGHGHKQCFPRNGYLSLDSATPVFSTHELVNNSENIWVEVNNADSVNAHTISVVVTLQERMVS